MSHKILVIGVSGAGKSTLAHELAARLGLPYAPTDGLYWDASWRPVSSLALEPQIDELTRAPAWVLDGNFDELRALVWSRADLIIWLDYPLGLTVTRLARRNLSWSLSQKPVWVGQPMPFSVACSGIRHGVRSFRVKRLTYPGWLAEVAFLETQVLRFRRPAHTRRWLEAL